LIRFPVLTLFFVLLGGCSSSAPRQGLPTSAGLEAKSLDERTLAVDELSRNREELIHDLLDLARKQEVRWEYHSSKELAINLLGYMRADSAADFLIENVSYQAGPLSRELVFGNHACAKALVEIGSLTVWDAVLRRLDAPLTADEQRLLAAVVWQIDGYDVGLFRVEKAIEGDGSTDTKSDNLAAIRQIFINHDFYVERTRMERP